jgi:hypothetical protein
MMRLPLYYYNIGHPEPREKTNGVSDETPWAEMQDSIDSLQPLPTKMYHEGIFTFNNRLIIIPPKSVPDTLDKIYNMPDGQDKRILIKLAESGASLVPCEEQNLFMAWHKSETEILRKERAGQDISAEEIGIQSVYLLTRNKVIGQVIAQTLPEDEAGILFLRAQHNLQGMMVNYLRDVQGLNVIEMNPQMR